MAYLEAEASAESVQAVRDWAGELSIRRAEMPCWRALLEALRLPPVVESRSPGALVSALRQGYIALFPEHGPTALLGPTTLELLLTAPKDAGLPPAVRRLVIWPRLAACAVGLLVGPMLIAVSSYHHALIPAPFLVAMAATRQNSPFPTVLEMFLVALLTDVAHSAAVRVTGRQEGFLGWIGAVLAITAAMQVGILGPITGVAGIAGAMLRETLPNEVLRRAVGIWRYLLMGAAAALGVYGLTLAGFGLAVYLAEEELFGQRLWQPPGAAS